jgi:hypothetical protein
MHREKSLGQLSHHQLTHYTGVRCSVRLAQLSQVGNFGRHSQVSNHVPNPAG